MEDNFNWWSQIIHAFLNKTERTTTPETSGKRIIVLNGNNKPNERIHVDKSSEYAINRKLAKILGR